MKIRIKGNLDAPVIKIAGPNGYSREFWREEQPFEATEREAEMLEGTGLFERVAEPAPFAAPQEDAA
jgi:hypothetical protein